MDRPCICSAAASDHPTEHDVTPPPPILSDMKTTWLKWVINDRQTFRRLHVCRCPPFVLIVGEGDVHRLAVSAHLAKMFLAICRGTDGWVFEGACVFGCFLLSFRSRGIRHVCLGFGRVWELWWGLNGGFYSTGMSRDIKIIRDK